MVPLTSNRWQRAVLVNFVVFCLRICVWKRNINTYVYVICSQNICLKVRHYVCIARWTDENNSLAFFIDMTSTHKSYIGYTCWGYKLILGNLISTYVPDRCHRNECPIWSMVETLNETFIWKFFFIFRAILKNKKQKQKNQRSDWVHPLLKLE